MSQLLPTLSQRLTTASTLILERHRVVVTLSLQSSPSTDAQIVRALTFVRDGLNRLRVEGTVGKEKELGELEMLYDTLVEQMEEQDEIGRAKVKQLKRPRIEVIRTPSPPVITTPTSSSSPPPPAHIPFRDSPSPDPLSSRPVAPISHNSFDIPRSSKPPSHTPFVVGDEDGEDEEELDNQGLLGNQRIMMDDQDARLNLLSHSIQKQSHLSLAIGSELELHQELLEETDEAMDRTGENMRRARRRLDKVGRGAKEHGSLITIVVLIVILLLLIVVFKT